MAPLKICLVASEVAPFAKTGGLADVTAALARYLTLVGHDVRVFLPFYATIDTARQDFLAVEFLRAVPVPLGGRTLPFTAFTTPLPGSPAWIYLINCPPLYGRGGLYHGDTDDARRFAYLSRAALDCCQRMGFAPDIIHCNDWHTGLLPLYLRALYDWDRLFARTRTVLTLHNVAFQGTFSSGLLPELGLAGHAERFWQEDLAAGRISFLKTGIVYADYLTTVSPTHAREIRTPAYGMGLEALLEGRADHLVGILNGVDYNIWSPEGDALLPARYSPADLTGKARCKEALLDEVGLPVEADPPVAGIVSRLTAQKGFDLLFDSLPYILANRPLKLVVLGTGEERYETFFAGLERRFPAQVRYRRSHDERLAHWIEAGADLFLMPSRYEPCGLNQMYSLRYGTPPVVRKTGGLADAVSLYNPATGEGTGFVFEHFTPEGFAWALDLAWDTYRNRAEWCRLMRNGMAQDFSWGTQIRKYEAVYRYLAGR